MIKQEISEIKKLFTERNCSITRIGKVKEREDIIYD
uniref:Uncharacterized protein n=1 Tax=Siphoviridae sp. ctLeh52 TaxID=2827849 RepID=A0A8S5RX37_9CAUD|nr:MAG TPA: protein of unknown function (DUF4317) [Siphoviridae sp. ctLeh52]